MQRLRFVPYHELGDIPNVIVDGSPAASTRLTLSHWPGSPTRDDLLDDLSAQIAFRALEQPHLFDGIEAVSNNHFDQDGMASAFALLHPDAARARRERVIDVARAGDFGTFHDRDSIRVAFALAAFADPDRSPLDATLFTGGYDEQTGRLHEALLPRFAELVDDPESTRLLWEAEDAHLTESLHAVAQGVVGLHEHAAIDLATVTVPEAWAERMTTRFTINRTEAVHPAAVNQSTRCLRIATIQGRRYRVEMRYETWVMFRSHPVLARPDLRLLAEQLTAAEPEGIQWSADAPGALTPTLQHTDDSGLAPEVFVALLEQFLRDAPPAWDPYAARQVR